MSREMVNSGIPWIGKIPKDWGINLLSSLFDEHKQKNKDLSETNLLSLSYGKIIRKDINTKEGLLPESFDGYNIISDGDIVFRLTDLQNDKRSLRTGLCLEKGIITSAYVTIRARQRLCSAYYHYLVHSYDVCKAFYGMGDGVRQGMNYSDLRKLLLVSPSYSEQQKIAEFLDRKCGEVDEMIGLQEQIIEELKAYKQSVITEAVTKGLNPDAPMKDSGIEWIGNIPEHWEVKRIKYIGTAENGLTYTPADVCDASEGILVLRSSNIQNGKLAFNDNVYVRSVPESLKVKVGDIIICSRNGSASLVGKSALVETDIDASFGAFMMRFRSNHSYKYIYFLLTATISHYKQLFTTTTINQLTIGLLNNIAMPFVEDKDEQQAIADYLDKKCGEIDELIAIKQSKIDSLKEYKKSIIYEYVTGKREIE